MRPFSTLIFFFLIAAFWGIGRITYPEKYAFGLGTTNPDSLQVADSPSQPDDFSKTIHSSKPKAEKRILNFSNPFASIDKHARKAPKSAEAGAGKLVEYLIAPAKNDLEKVRAIFTWVADRVKYDDDGYNSGNYADTKAETVFYSRLAVCEGYANVFKMLCDSAGLECQKISGYAKGYSFKEGGTFDDSNHAWNAVKIDGRWRLIDVTWGEGNGSNVDGRMVSKKEFDDSWFDVNPYAFIFSHLPESASQQFLPKPINMATFLKMPWLKPDFFDAGFDAKAVFAAAQKNRLEVVENYHLDHKVNIKGAPVERTIPNGKSFQIEVVSDEYSYVMVHNGGSYQKYALDNHGRALITVSPSETGSLTISVGKSEWESFSIILSYQVGRKEDQAVGVLS